MLRVNYFISKFVLDALRKEIERRQKLREEIESKKFEKDVELLSQKDLRKERREQPIESSKDPQVEENKVRNFLSLWLN